jgi:hypothetical protein
MDEEGIGALARKACKGRINLADRRGVNDLDLQSKSVGSFLVPLLPVRLGLRQGQAGASREAALKRAQPLFRLVFVQILQCLGGRTVRAVSGLV